MTHHPTAALCVDRVLPLLPKPLNVCELGNQRYTAQKYDPKPKTTQEFYEQRGFQYVCIDVNERMGAVAADLNELLDNPLALGRKSLVTNNGTSEHIFNQATVFENMHDLCATGGIMLHILPFAPWINHGFYNYNPIFFADLAAANGYETVFFDIMDREGTVAELSREDLLVDKRPAKLEAVLAAFYAGKFQSHLFNCVAFKKAHDKPFQMPMQGKYKKDIENEHIKRAYAG